MIDLWCDGDSITRNNYNETGDPWPTQMLALLGAGYTLHNIAVSGQTLDDQTADVATQVDANFTAGAIYFVWNWYNNSGLSAVAIQTKIQTLCEGRRSAGFKVLVGTNFHNVASLDTASDWVRTNWASFADGLVELDLQSLRDNVAGTDGVHPNTAGAAIIAALMADGVLDVSPTLTVTTANFGTLTIG